MWSGDNFKHETQPGRTRGSRSLQTATEGGARATKVPDSNRAENESKKCGRKALGDFEGMYEKFQLDPEVYRKSA